MWLDEVGILVSHHSASVRAKIQRALDWSKKYKIFSSSETEDFRKIAALVLFHEMVSKESTMTGEILCQEASANISDIAPWLRNNFHFPMKDVYTMLTTWMTSGANKLPFNPVDLNSQYEIMQEAASLGDMDLIQWLLLNGVEIDTKDSDGRTALHVAAQKGHNGLGIFLLENGASILLMDSSSQTPFYKALDSGNFDTADLLGPVWTRPKNFKELLIRAAGDDSAEKVEYLLEHVNHRKICFPCVSDAAGNGHCAIAEALIIHCPWYQEDLGLVDNLLYLAAEEGHTHLADLLLSIGARVDQRTREVAQENILNLFEKFENSSEGSQIDVVSLSSYSEDSF